MVTFVVLQIPIVSAVQWGSSMSAVDWTSEQDYANFKNAETADIAWEWLRRNSEYEQDFGNLTAAAQSSGTPHQFRKKWGLSFRC
jgi:hypothetical protein